MSLNLFLIFCLLTLNKSNKGDKSARGHHQQPAIADRAGAVAGNAVSGAFRLVARRWRLILAYQVLCFTTLIFTFSVMGGKLCSIDLDYLSIH